jgi:hypothetical protein
MNAPKLPPGYAAMAAVLAAQAKTIDVFWDTTRATFGVVHEAAIRQMTLAQEMVTATAVAATLNPQDAATRMAALGWQTSQELGRSLTTLGEQINQTLNEGCAKLSASE